MGATTPSTKLENLLTKIQPCKFASYQEFMRALMIETLPNTSMTFDQLNYDLFALNREVFNHLNRETTAFFKLLANKQQCLIPDGATMEQSNRLDKILQQMDPSLLQGYKKLMHEVIIQGISYHDLTFDTLNRYLFDFNKEVFDVVCEKAISYYEMHAPERIKSYGN